MRAILAGVAVVATLFTWADAVAQDKAQLEAAKAAFKSGQEHMNAGRFADAVAQFKKAYEVTKDKLVMGQVALAYEKGGDYKAALEAIRVYREALPASDRASVDELIKRYEKKIAAGETKPLLLPGAAPPGETGTPAKPGDTGEEEEEEESSAVDDADEDEEESGGRFWTWIAAGTAGALTLSALVIGLNAQSKFDDLETTCKPACADSEVDSVKTRALVADVFWGVAAAAAVTSVILYFVESPSKSAEAADEEDDDLSAKLRFAPLIGQGRVGLGATLRY